MMTALLPLGSEDSAKIDNIINQNKINDCEYMKITSNPECFYYSYTQRFSFQNLTNIDYETLSLV